MVSLYNYFIKSVFIKGIENPSNNMIIPSSDLSSLTNEQLKKIKFGIWEYKTDIINETDNNLEFNGIVRTFEKNNGRNLDDVIRFHANIDVYEDEVMLETEINVDREVSGELHDLPSVRDGLLPFGYQTGSTSINIIEYYTLIADGKRLLHHSPYTTSFEVYDIDSIDKFGEGMKYCALKVFTSENYDMEDPDIKEIETIIKSRIDVMKLIKR